MINRNRLFFFLRFFISFFLIAFIVSRVDFGEVTRLLPTVKLPFVLLGLFLLLLDRVVMSYRWAVLLWVKGISIALLTIIKIYFLSSFWGTFLPSSVAPDFIKVYVARKHGSSTSDVLSSVVVDRVIGLFSLSLVAFLSVLAVFFFRRSQASLTVFLVVLITLLLPVLLVFSDRLPLRGLAGLFRFREESTLWKFAKGFYRSCRGYKNNRAALLKVLSTSFLNHVLSILTVYILCLSLGIQIPILYLFVLVPLVNFLVIIPISVGGIGIQEGAFVYFLSQVGMSVQEALTVALLFRALTVAASLPGGVIYILEGTDMKKLPSTNS